MNLRFRSWKLKYKLLLVCLLLSIVPLIVMGLSCYFLADRALYKQIEEKLVIQAGYYRTLLTDNMATARTDTDAARVNAQTIVKQQAEILTKFFRLAGNANLEDLKNAVASLVVGKTGYVYVLDYAGRYVVSKGRQRDGDNIYGSTDANGRFFIQEILKKGRVLAGDAVDFDIYPWKNAGESAARDKIAAIIHVPRLGWVVGVSAYFDDVVDIALQEKEIARFKTKLKAEKVGERGYMYVMDGKGMLVMHPDKEGQSLAENDFAKEMIRKKNRRRIPPLHVGRR
jgi:signal transduction histidine kinase